jgi:hypothetical protein
LRRTQGVGTSNLSSGSEQVASDNSFALGAI